MELLENFYEKDKYFKSLYNSYKNKLDYFYDKAKKQVVRKEYARGGETIHRGFYCPSPVQDIIVGNCKRGKLVKKPRKIPDYEYWFDDNNHLILVEQICTYNIKIPSTIELLFYNDIAVNSILYQENKFDSEEEFQISFLTKCIYENGLIKNYDFASVFNPLQDHAEICCEIETENFEYDDKLLVSSTLESYNFDVKILSQNKYFYNYDGNRKMISYTTEEYDNGKRISSIWDNHSFII